MQELIQVGDVVKSVAGRDKEKSFLVIAIYEDKAKLVDGKTRKIAKPKTKNVKHIQKVSPVKLTGFAEKIINGEPIGNERLRKAISTVNEKI